MTVHSEVKTQEWSASVDAWHASVAVARARALRIRAMRRERLDRVCLTAGLGHYNGCSVHNALLSADQGRPWRGVDYSLARRARRLADALCEADAIASRYADRTMPRLGR